MWVRGAPVTNVYVPGYWEGNAMCTGVYDELTGLCGGPWCLDPAAARDAIRQKLTEVFSRHLGATTGGVLGRVFAPQVHKKLRGLQPTP